MGEAPNLECTVRGIHTIDRGSRLLSVLYVFRASASDYSWWSIIVHLLHQHKALGISSKITNVVLPSTLNMLSYITA